MTKQPVVCKPCIGPRHVVAEEHPRGCPPARLAGATVSMCGVLVGCHQDERRKARGFSRSAVCNKLIATLQGARYHHGPCHASAIAHSPDRPRLQSACRFAPFFFLNTIRAADLTMASGGEFSIATGHIFQRRSTDGHRTPPMFRGPTVFGRFPVSKYGER
jgi:hypothetical protein